MLLIVRAACSFDGERHHTKYMEHSLIYAKGRDESVQFVESVSMLSDAEPNKYKTTEY